MKIEIGMYGKFEDFPYLDRPVRSVYGHLERIDNDGYYIRSKTFEPFQKFTPIDFTPIDMEEINHDRALLDEMAECLRECGDDQNYLNKRENAKIIHDILARYNDMKKEGKG